MFFEQTGFNFLGKCGLQLGDFWIFTCMCVITGFECIPLSSGRKDSVELLPLPHGFSTVCLFMYILLGNVLCTPPSLLLLRPPQIHRATECLTVKSRFSASVTFPGSRDLKESLPSSDFSFNHRNQELNRDVWEKYQLCKVTSGKKHKTNAVLLVIPVFSFSDWQDSILINLSWFI